MAISLSELNPKNHPLTTALDANLHKLWVAMNIVRVAYGKPMIITSGYRTPEEQVIVSPGHPHDAHVLAAACDVADNNFTLWNWLCDNLAYVAHAGMYLENEACSPGHVHFQIYPPISGHRIFNA